MVGNNLQHVPWSYGMMHALAKLEVPPLIIPRPRLPPLALYLSVSFTHAHSLSLSLSLPLTLSRSLARALSLSRSLALSLCTQPDTEAHNLPVPV